MVDRNSCSNAFGLPLSPKNIPISIPQSIPAFRSSFSLHMRSPDSCNDNPRIVLQIKGYPSLRSVANCPPVIVYKRRPYVFVLPGFVYFINNSINIPRVLRACKLILHKRCFNNNIKYNNIIASLMHTHREDDQPRARDPDGVSPLHRGWAKASTRCLRVWLSCVIHCQWQYSSSSSLRRLSGLPQNRLRFPGGDTNVHSLFRILRSYTAQVHLVF